MKICGQCTRAGHGSARYCKHCGGLLVEAVKDNTGSNVQKNNKTILLIALFIVVGGIAALLIGITTRTTTQSGGGGGLRVDSTASRFHSDTYRFSFVPPDGWRKRTGTRGSITGYTSIAYYEKPASAVRLTVTEHAAAAGGASLNEWSAEVDRTSRQMVTNWRKTFAQEMQLDSQPAKMLVEEGSMRGNPIKAKTVLLNDRVGRYIMISLTSNPVEYEADQGVFDALLNTFQFDSQRSQGDR